MVSHLVFSQRGLLALGWVFLRLSRLWPSGPAAARPMPPQPLMRQAKRSTKPKPFPSLTHQPSCAAWKPAIEAPRRQLAPPPPPQGPSTRGRRRHVAPSAPCWPERDCRYGGWLGLGPIPANGHPRGRPWRQLSWGACHGSLLETRGTPWHGHRVSPARLVWASGALAAGLGLRAVVRGCEGDPNPGRAWGLEVAAHATAFSRSFLHAVRVTQVPLDALLALRRAVQTGAVSAAAAVQRLAHSPHGVWAALAPVTKRLRTVEGGDRPRVMAPRVGYEVVHILAPGGVPRCLTEGFKASMTALRTHDGPGLQLARPRAQGPAPPPRWRPGPGRLSAQGITTGRQRRRVRITPRVVVGTLEAVEPG